MLGKQINFQKRGKKVTSDMGIIPKMNQVTSPRPLLCELTRKKGKGFRGRSLHF